MGKLKSKDRQAGSSSRSARRTSDASQPQDQQQGQAQRAPATYPRIPGPLVPPGEMKASFATGSSQPEASIPLTQMLAYTYASEATQARMRDASPLLRHAIAYRSANGQERRRMKEALPAVIEEEKRRLSGSQQQQQVAFRRPYVAPKCRTNGVKVPGHSCCQDRRCHCNVECSGGEDCVLCATYMSGRGGGAG